MKPELKQALQKFQSSIAAYKEECLAEGRAEKTLKELYIEMFERIIEDGDALEKRVAALENSRQFAASV